MADMGERGSVWINETSDTASLRVERSESGWVFTISEEPSGSPLAYVRVSPVRGEHLLRLMTKDVEVTPLPDGAVFALSGASEWTDADMEMIARRLARSPKYLVLRRG